LNPTELDNLIGKFLLSIRKVDGEEYEPDTITSFHHGIERYLREHSYKYSIIKDREFKMSRSVLASKRKEMSRSVLASKRKELKQKGKEEKANKSEPLTTEEEDILKNKLYI
jgi:hypothetical protein